MGFLILNFIVIKLNLNYLTKIIGKLKLLLYYSMMVV